MALRMCYLHVSRALLWAGKALGSEERAVTDPVAETGQPQLNSQSRLFRRRARNTALAGQIQYIGGTERSRYGFHLRVPSRVPERSGQAPGQAPRSSTPPIHRSTEASSWFSIGRNPTSERISPYKDTMRPSQICHAAETWSECGGRRHRGSGCTAAFLVRMKLVGYRWESRGCRGGARSAVR